MARYSNEDRAGLLNLLKKLAKYYGKPESFIDVDVAKMYEFALHDLPLDSVKRKAFEHMKKSPFFPKACDLRNEFVAKRIAMQRRLARQVREGVAYQKIKQLRKQGAADDQLFAANDAYNQIVDEPLQIGQLIDGRGATT